MENLTVLPYLRIYFRVLNAIEKSCFETLHATSCVLFHHGSVKVPSAELGRKWEGHFRVVIFGGVHPLLSVVATARAAVFDSLFS